MKKLFALFLSFALLFLTSCNNSPADSTIGTGNPQNPIQPNETEQKDTIIYNETSDFIDLPSRIAYKHVHYLSHNHGITQIHYYSKADGKSYAYCFDPLCEHPGGYCFVHPSSMETGYIDLYTTLFINNRFYAMSMNGKIISYSFDGIDMKIEYDAGYDINANVWSPNPTSYGNYIYIPMRADEKGNPHTLRFNTETGEMEDLTEKTGNYIFPIFFYNGEIYGYDAGVGRLKSDLDLNDCEETEKIPFSRHFSGSRFFNQAYDDKWNAIGIQIYDMKTGKSEIMTNEAIGIENAPYILYIDDNYIYFYQGESIYLGDYLYKDDDVRKYTKGNDGSIYRINHDGTGLMCIYEEDEFEITGFEAIISGNQFLVKGHNVRVHDRQVEVWDTDLLVGTIGADGKISELKPVEVVE